MKIKDRLKKEEFADFNASNGLFEKWKMIYGIREKQLYGEADDVSKNTVHAWIERLPELVEGYELHN